MTSSLLDFDATALNHFFPFFFEISIFGASEPIFIAIKKCFGFRLRFFWPKKNNISDGAGLYWVILCYTGLYWFLLGYTGL